MLTGLFTDILIISATTSLVIIGLKLLSPFLSKSYAAQWKYWTWMIIAVRLLLPFNFSFAQSLVQIQVPDSPLIEAVLQSTVPPNIPANTPVAVAPVQETADYAAQPPSLLAVLALVWLVGTALFALYRLIGYIMFKRQALRWSSPIRHTRTTAKVDQVFREMNVQPALAVLTSESVPNPMLVGLRKPLLFLPHENYTDEELEFILRHELVHYKRHDILYKLLLVAQSVHWFNPFVWLLAREAGREIENYCDDTVVREKSLTYRKKYCEAILSAMHNQNTRSVDLSTSFAGRNHTIKQRFVNILNMKKKRNGIVLICTVLLLTGAVGLLAACTSVKGTGSALEQGTLYSVGFDGHPFVTYDAGHSYSVDSKGNVSIAYTNGAVTAKVPLKLDTTGNDLGMSKDETGFFISEDKTAIVYGFANGTSKPLHVLISDDKGKTWKESEIEGSMGYDTKFIGFTTNNDGWIVSGASHGVASALNYVYQTSDGGITWKEIGNPNDIYSEHLTGVGFSDQNIGFLGYRYFSEPDPIIYWTKNRGQSWERLSVTLPNKFDKYSKNPLSPIFNGKEALFPINLLEGNTGEIGTIYLSSKDGGLTWNYDASLDKLDNLE